MLSFEAGWIAFTVRGGGGCSDVLNFFTESDAILISVGYRLNCDSVTMWWTSRLICILGCSSYRYMYYGILLS